MIINITIGFSRAKSPLAIYGKLIQAIESRPYSHAYVRFTDVKSKQEMVFQAAHGLVNLYNYDKFLEKNDVAKEYKLKVTEDQFQILWSFMMTTLGTNYGWLQALGIFIIKLTKGTNPFKDQISTEICSELAARVCSILGIQINKDFDDITPSDLDRILGEHFYG